MVNPNYKTEEYQFHTFIPVNGMTLDSSANITLICDYPQDFFSAKVEGGGLRIYAKLVPISGMTAVVQFSDGSVNSSDVTIPAGRMRGDVNDDGMVNPGDLAILNSHLSGSNPLTDEISLLAADANNNGTINNMDMQRVHYVVNESFVGALGELTGNWEENPNYETEEYQFYTDVLVSGMTSTCSVLMTVEGDYEEGFFRAECIDGALRIYAKRCPIDEVNATIQFGEGVVKTTEAVTPTGVMRGDINADGVVDDADKQLILAHINGTTLLTSSEQYHAADINGDGDVSTADNTLLLRAIRNTASLGSLGVENCWNPNPTYETEEHQFFTVTPYVGAEAGNIATVSVTEVGGRDKDFFRFEPIDGALRVYAKRVPIGVTTVVYDYLTEADATLSAYQIPFGHMRGDVDGNGNLDDSDLTIVTRHVAKQQSIVDATQLLAADVNGDGSIDATDMTLLARIVRGWDQLGDSAGDFTGNWAVNPNYETDNYQFYTDNIVSGIESSHTATITVDDSYGGYSFHAECFDGVLRVYANRIPTEAVEATVHIWENAHGYEHVPAGRMRGDVDGDGVLTDADLSAVARHVAKIHFITDETALLAADVNGDGDITSDDATILARIVAGSVPTGTAAKDLTGNWEVNPDYETDEYQFYYDIPNDDLTVESSITDVQFSPDYWESDFFRAECIDDAVKIYAKAIPAEDVTASVRIWEGVKTTTVATPIGRMRGDVDGNGVIMENDGRLVAKHFNGNVSLDEIALWCSDVTMDGDVDGTDKVQINLYTVGMTNCLTTTPTLADYYNNWQYVKIDDYTGEFYTDIPISDMTSASVATATFGGDYEEGFFRTECVDGALRVYAKRCPLTEVSVEVQYTYGLLAARSADNIPAGRMRGDVTGDGSITTGDAAILNAHCLRQASLLRADAAENYLAADVVWDGTLGNL